MEMEFAGIGRRQDVAERRQRDRQQEHRDQKVLQVELPILLQRCLRVAGPPGQSPAKCLLRDPQWNLQDGHAGQQDGDQDDGLFPRHHESPMRAD